MPVTNKTWSPEGLWPKATFAPWFAPGGGPAWARSSWGQDPAVPDGILDIGALKTDDKGVWLVFMPAGWEPFDPTNPGHKEHANRFNRYGAGHSFGAGLLNGHGRTIRPQIIESWRQVFGGDPTNRDLVDVEFSRDLAAQLGLLGGKTPQTPPSAPAVPLEQRLARIESMLAKILAALPAAA